MTVRIRRVTTADSAAVRRLLGRIAVFEPHEVRVADELLAESLAGNVDYVIHVAEDNNASHEGAEPLLLGYVCHGHNPVTDALYDLYWIAVDPAVQGRGVGRALLTHAEQCVRDSGGRGVVVETSGRVEYEPARQLYVRCGYQRVAAIADYYKPGEGLFIYMKLL